MKPKREQAIAALLLLVQPQAEKHAERVIRNLPFGTFQDEDVTGRIDVTPPVRVIG